MVVTVNGQEETMAERQLLATYLCLKGIAPEAFLIMLNGRVLQRDQLEEIVLQENDQLEILRLVGGG